MQETAVEYWAITGLGWGRGSTPVEAVEVYLRAQRRNFPKLSEAELAEAWGFVWRAPDGADGFTRDASNSWWTFEDGPAQEFDYDGGRVLNVGNVPERFQV